MLPEDDPGGRAAAAPGVAGAQSLFCAAASARPRPTARPRWRWRVAAGDRVAEAELLNTLGMAYASLGDVERGIASLRRAIDLARANDDFDSLATAYCNLADMLSVAGQTEEALRMAREGLSVTPSHHVRSYEWLKLTVAGDGVRPRVTGAPPGRRCRHRRRARRACCSSSASCRGRAGARRRRRGRGGRVPGRRAGSRGRDQPSRSGSALYGALRAELLMRRRDLAGAQAAVQEALDRLEVCTDDVMRIAWVSCVGLWVEADRAQRARDLRETGERRDALARARMHADRLAAAAQDGGPVEHARLTQGKAELARARGRGGRPGMAPGGGRLGGDQAALPGGHRPLARGRGACRRR